MNENRDNLDISGISSDVEDEINNISSNHNGINDYDIDVEEEGCVDRSGDKPYKVVKLEITLYTNEEED